MTPRIGSRISVLFRVYFFIIIQLSSKQHYRCKNSTSVSSECFSRKQHDIGGIAIHFFYFFVGFILDHEIRIGNTGIFEGGCKKNYSAQPLQTIITFPPKKKCPSTLLLYNVTSVRKIPVKTMPVKSDCQSNTPLIVKNLLSASHRRVESKL